MEPVEVLYIALAVLILILTIGVVGILVVLLWIMLTIRNTAKDVREFALSLDVLKDSFLVSALSIIGSILGKPKKEVK